MRTATRQQKARQLRCKLPCEASQGAFFHAAARPYSGKSPERLPRTRGDGPMTKASTYNVVEAPPHTRGWTLVEREAVTVARGSPAHAGMDPRNGRSWT